MEIILGAVEQYPWDNSSISKCIKCSLDNRLGASWHVIVGATYSFDIGFESEYIIYMFYGSLGILAWKCGTMLINESQDN